ncbi:hypothetical protein EHS25_005185 [Saitozyma podzolica]|uniref:Dihydrolipoamide acetyltransferase component of pyruvate dehydrogenase complex n=1 Tax=Saitozyma podzolica TaxID=1890683 RepID=A0A427XYN4_9TREE|nr:hypothetical protein EHS25_005185 [Saitozyma podzolica]
MLRRVLHARLSRAAPRSSLSQPRLVTCTHPYAPTHSPSTSPAASHLASQPSSSCPSRHVLSGLLRRSFHTSSSIRAIQPFKLHDIGEGITEVELIKWDVEEGQEVVEFDVLCEVQSDKSTVELTSPATGKIRKLRAKPGETIHVGETLCEIDVGGEAGAEADATQETEAQPSASEQTELGAAAKQTQSPAVGGAESGTTPISAPAPTPRQDSSSFASQVRVEETSYETSELEHSLLQSQDSAMESAGGGRFSGEGAILPSAPRSHHPLAPEEIVQRMARTVSDGERKIAKASPAVRTLAAKLGVRLEDVRPTGEAGRVTRDDVRAAAGGGAAVGSGKPAESREEAASERRQGPRDAVSEVTRVEFGRTRKVMYRAMGDMGSVPHFGYSHTLNLTPLLPYLQTLNPPSSSSKPSYLASDIPPELALDPIATSGDAARQKTTLLSFLVKGLLLAMEEHPILRARVKEKDGARWLDVARDGTIGVAVSDKKYGLVTPSLPSLPPSTSLGSITSHLLALRSNPTKPSPPANLTISSVGALGEARAAMPVLPPGGGVAICAVGRARWEVEWKKGSERPMTRSPEEVREGGLEAVLRVPVGWSGDHRVLEGAELIAFTETWKKYIEEPWRWLKVD